MHLNIRGRKVPISAALREHCSERLERALRPFNEHVRSAELVLTDFNGPRGGIGQACSVFVTMVGGSRFMVQSIESDFYTASGHAAARAGQLVRRELTKVRGRARIPARGIDSRDTQVANRSERAPVVMARTAG